MYENDKVFYFCGMWSTLHAWKPFKISKCQEAQQQQKLILNSKFIKSKIKINASTSQKEQKQDWSCTWNGGSLHIVNEIEYKTISVKRVF